MAGPLWVALSYRLPREPSRLRLAVWRRLRRLGAILLHDSLWLLPADAKTREAFEWLAEEIEEQGGTALVWEAASFDPAQDERIVARFRAEADARYAAIAESAEALRRLAGRRLPGRSRLEQARRQLAGLERALRLESRRDHFRAPGRRAAGEAIAAAGQALNRAGRSHPADSGKLGGKANAVGH
ncbi:MAG TPA: Chromate resistance protein ChrB [Gemmatimonadales bacterium]|nr:Chromate resistance protein ChrB [Gemmatimonadales bacterium]